MLRRLRRATRPLRHGLLFVGLQAFAGALRLLPLDVSLAVGALLALWLHTGWVLAGAVAAVPLGLTLFWAILLKHGRPPGHDRDWLDQKFGGGDFTRSRSAQRGLLDA